MSRGNPYLRPLPGHILDGKWVTRKLNPYQNAAFQAASRAALRPNQAKNTAAMLAAKDERPIESIAREKVGLFKTWNILRAKRAGFRTVTPRHRAKLSKAALHKHEERQAKKHAKSAREIQQTALENALGAMEVATEIMYDKRQKGSDRLSAVELVLNRAAGRPTQTNINASIDANANPSEASGAELDTRIAETLQRIDTIAGGAKPKAARKKRPLNIRSDNRDPGRSNVH